MNLPFLKKKDKSEEGRVLADHAFLLELKPDEGYIFHSGHYEVDGCFATIMSFFHKEGANDGFAPFWGICRVPQGLDDDITTVCFEQVRRMTDGWIHDHQSKAEAVAETNANEQSKTGTNSTKGKASRKDADLRQIAEELQNGASYLHVQYRILVKAPTLDKLDAAVEAIDRFYIDRFATVSAAPYQGRQRDELSHLFSKNEAKTGKGFYFTSTEFAGSYSLVTHGLEDPGGEYIGYMAGDVNNSAVLFDVDKYGHHIVVSNDDYDNSLGRVRVSGMWGSKVSQACLLNDHKVVHIILDGDNLDDLGPKFSTITYPVDMGKGSLNMFEMFGREEDELSIFASQMEKLKLMAEQALGATSSDITIIRNSLESVLTKFYVDQGMWFDNAQHNRGRLRVVGVPHADVPKLEVFASYLETEYKRILHMSAKDETEQTAVNILRGLFKSLLSSNGDLFNTTTTKVIDGVPAGRRVVYDFSGLMSRGVGVAMAQFVNVIGFAVGNIGYRDTLIIHGTEKIADSVKPYLGTQLERLWDKGGRVCYLYNDLGKMLLDKDFSHFDTADYTVMGTMSETEIVNYQKELGQEIPRDLAQNIAQKGSGICYIRRRFDNVVFNMDLCLGRAGERRRR